MEILNYLPVIIGIKNSDFTPLLNKNLIKNINPIDNHTKLLSKLYDANYPVSMIFSNEILLLRNLGNIADNEIKHFIESNSTWDLLILSPFDISIPVSSIPDYTILKKIDDTSTFFYNKIYIASRRFMQKIKNNDISNIESYVYTDPFLDNMETTPIVISKKNLYTIGIITNIKIIKVDNIIYSWKELEI